MSITSTEYKKRQLLNRMAILQKEEKKALKDAEEIKNKTKEYVKKMENFKFYSGNVE